MEDITIACKDCPNEFVISAGEQEFYADKGMVLPKRCKPCRIIKKQQRANEDNSQA